MYPSPVGHVHVVSRRWRALPSCRTCGTSARSTFHTGPLHVQGYWRGGPEHSTRGQVNYASIWRRERTDEIRAHLGHERWVNGHATMEHLRGGAVTLWHAANKTSSRTSKRRKAWLVTLASKSSSRAVAQALPGLVGEVSGAPSHRKILRMERKTPRMQRQRRVLPRKLVEFQRESGGPHTRSFHGRTRWRRLATFGLAGGAGSTTQSGCKGLLDGVAASCKPEAWTQKSEFGQKPKRTAIGCRSQCGMRCVGLVWCGARAAAWGLAPRICHEARMCRSALFCKMTISDCDLLLIGVERVSVLCMNVCVQPSYGCKQLTTNDFSKLQRLEAGSLTLCNLKHERKISGCVTARAKYTNAGNVPLWTVQF